MKNMFAILQKIGRAFMLPIAVLPMAGIFLGVGGAFTSPNLINTYHLTFLEAGQPLHYFMVLLFKAGLFVFANLPLLFAVGVAIGLADKNKETSAISAVLGFLLFHTVIGVMLGFHGITPDVVTVDYLTKHGVDSVNATGKAALYTSELGIFTLQTGVFGGIICGILSAFVTNKFSNKKLPDYLAFFSGNRLVPVVTMVVFIPLGILVSFIWEPIFNSIVHAGEAFSAMGYIGTFLYGFLMRILNIFGLHHAIYPLFWYTELGGVMNVAGDLVAGGQKIFFAQLADPSVQHFSSEATRTMTGGFLPMMFGLPAAAYAMYVTVDKDNRTKVKGLLVSAALTSFLTGITEPIEFTFLFVAPVLYIVHALLEGFAYMIMHILNVAVGITFSRGIIDFTFFGLLQGTAKTSYQWILIIGPIYSIIYFFVFKYLIIKLNLATPGRLNQEAVLYTRTDYNSMKETLNSDTKNNQAVDSEGSDIISKKSDLIENIVAALGGINNIKNIDACITRLRVTVVDNKIVAKDELWQQLGSRGVIRSGNGIQIIYGTQAETYKNQIIERYNIG